MELTVNLGFDELLKLIKKLPSNQIAKLKAELDNQSSVAKTKTDISEFQQLLLSGPVMTEEQFGEYKKLRKQLNVWRQK